MELDGKHETTIKKLKRPYTNTTYMIHFTFTINGKKITQNIGTKEPNEKIADLKREGY